MNKWVVKVPAGRWMAGIQRFTTKKQALAFIARWNEVETEAGNEYVEFVRAEGFTFEQVAMKTVRNRMTGKLISIPANTPRCCDPSTELYWSM